VKIAYVASMTNGLETFVKNEIEGLHERKVGISLFVTKYKKSLGFEPIQEIAINKPSLLAVFKGLLVTIFCKPKRLFLLLMEAIKYGALVELALAISWHQKIIKENHDRVHAAFGDRKFFIAYFIHRFTDLPLSVAIHAHEIYAQPNDLLFRHALGFTHKILTISETNRQILINNYAIPETKISLIRLPINTEYWKPTKRLTVLTVARYTPRKGWMELISAAKILGERFQFIAVGFGDLDLESMTKEADVDDLFTVFPKLNSSQIKVLMQSADIFCLPSKYTEDEGSEGIPVVLMEAMSMGLPIVTTSDGSITELVTQTIVEPGNVEALIEGLESVATEIKNNGVRWAGDNRERVSQLHGPDNILHVQKFFESLD
jgi:glycosyltransferase involved in cell wall biosynthesis